MSHHTVRFPNESDAYRAARDELLTAEIALKRQIEEVAAQRRRLPLGGRSRRTTNSTRWAAAACASRSCSRTAKTR